MSTYQGRNAQLRQTVRAVLAELKGVPPNSIPYPRSNVKLAEYREEIQAIRDFESEVTRLREIDSYPHYEVIFNQRDQVQVGKEITDSNFIADIAIGTPGEHDYEEILNIHRGAIKQILQDENNRLGPIKVRIGIFGTLKRITNYQQELFEEISFTEETGYDYRYHVPFKTRNMPILPATNIDDTINFGYMRIAERVDRYQNYGSGWEFYRVEKIFIEITQFQPPTGAGHIPILKSLAAKKGIINPVNQDEKCFQWAILIALHESQNHPERIAQYKQYEKELNFENIEFPVQADEIILRRFERQNPKIALAIYEWKGRLSPIYVTDK